MTPAIATAGMPFQAADDPVVSAASIDSDDDAFRSALAALFGIVGSDVAPAPEASGTPAQLVKSVELEPKTDNTREDSREDGGTLRGKVAGAPAEPPKAIPAVLVNQILGLTPPPAPAELAQELKQDEPAVPSAATRPEIGLAAAPAVELTNSETSARRADMHEVLDGNREIQGVAFEVSITETLDRSEDAAKPESAAKSLAETRRGPRNAAQELVAEVESQQPRKRQADAPETPRAASPQIHALKTEVGRSLEPRTASPQGAQAQRPVQPTAADRVEPVAVRHLRLQLAPDPARPVQLLVAERAGAVHISVRANEATVSHALRADLQGLVAALERTGLRAETFAPPDAPAVSATRPVSPEMSAHTETDRGDGQRRWNQESRQRNRRGRDEKDDAGRFSLEYSVERSA